MKYIILTCTLFALLLSACGNNQPVPPETVTSLPTNTPFPAATATSIPMVNVDGVQVPDPKVTNSELFDLKNPESPIVQFANAFGVKPEDVGTLTGQVKTGVDGKKIVFLVTGDLTATTDFNELDTPLFVAEQGKDGQWVWSPAWPIQLVKANGMILEAPMAASREIDPAGKYFDKIANQVFLSGEDDASEVFRNFTSDDWRRVITNWPAIKTQLDHGNVPQGFTYNWINGNRAIDYAKSHGMTVRAQHLLWGGDVPDSIYSGGFTKDEVKLLAEFIVKTRVLEYNGIPDANDLSKDPGRIVIQWDVADEWAATESFQHDKWPFWLTNLGFPGAIADVSHWVSEANPNAEQVVTEDGILYLPKGNEIWKNNFAQLLNFIIQNKLPVKRVDIENNFTVFNPPDQKTEEQNLKAIMDTGFKVTSETTVVSGNPNAIWDYRPISTPKDPKIEQANIYGENLLTYLKVGADQYGLGGISNADEWYAKAGITNANSMILDNNHQPTPAFYSLLQVLYSNLH